MATEDFCVVPPELGCPPSLDRVLEHPDALCLMWGGSYSECSNGEVMLELIRGPTRLFFDERTGRLIEAETHLRKLDRSTVCSSPTVDIYAGDDDVLGPPENCVSCTLCMAEEQVGSDSPPCVIDEQGRLALP